MRDQEFFVQHGLTLGRGEANAVCIPDSEVELLHARILYCSDDELRVVCEPGVQLQTDTGLCDSLVLEPDVSFQLGGATLSCHQQNSRTRSDVHVTDNPWSARCPFCHESLVEAPRSLKKCHACHRRLSFIDAPENGSGASFSGWIPRRVGPYVVDGFVACGGMAPSSQRQMHRLVHRYVGTGALSVCLHNGLKRFVRVP